MLNNSTLAIGNGSFFNSVYIVISAGYSYYVTNDLEVGFDVDFWTGGALTLIEVTPQLTYAFKNRTQVTPYIRTSVAPIIENLNDSDSIV